MMLMGADLEQLSKYRFSLEGMSSANLGCRVRGREKRERRMNECTGIVNRK